MERWQHSCLGTSPSKAWLFLVLAKPSIKKARKSRVLALSFHDVCIFSLLVSHELEGDGLHGTGQGEVGGGFSV